MGAVRRPAYAVFVVLVVLAAGCGGGSKTGSKWEGPTGASIAPASALGFVAINTDKGSTQWKNADALLKKFPSRDKLFASIEKSLSDNGVDFNTKILPLLGPEVDLVVLDGGASSPQLVVGMTKPSDASTFTGYLDAASPPAPHIELDGWTVFARSQAALDAFTKAQANGKLADDASFKEATGHLATDANGIAFLNGTKGAGLLKGNLPLGAVPADQLQWLAVALSSQLDSAKLDGVFKTIKSFGTPFNAKLLYNVPSGALAVVSFHGSDQLTRQLNDNPAVAQAAGPIKEFLGVALTDLTPLVEGEGVLYVFAGAPYPEVTLMLTQRHPEAAMATMNTVAAKLADRLNGTLADYPGSAAMKLHLGKIAIYYGILNRTLIISDASGHVITGAGVPLRDDPLYTKARKAAGVPFERAGLVYVNFAAMVPLLQGYAHAVGTEIPLDVLRNLARLESFMAWATGDGSVTRFSALLQVR
jgi:hypothetical protein